MVGLFPDERARAEGSISTSALPRITYNIWFSISTSAHPRIIYNIWFSISTYALPRIIYNIWFSIQNKKKKKIQFIILL